METDQAEQLHSLLDQSVQVLNNVQEAEKTDISTSKRDYRSPSSLENQSSLISVEMTEKR